MNPSLSMKSLTVTYLEIFWLLSKCFTHTLTHNIKLHHKICSSLATKQKDLNISKIESVTKNKQPMYRNINHKSEVEKETCMYVTKQSTRQKEMKQNFKIVDSESKMTAGNKRQ